MEIRYDRGILIKDGNDKILLDSETTRTPIGIPTIISHAHSDHTQALSGQSISHLNQITLDLYNTTKGRTAKHVLLHEVNEPFELNNFEIEFIPAGHLLGASQIIVRKSNQTIHFTGDFCPDHLLTIEPAQIPKDVDVSLIDTTYGTKNVHFDTRESTRQQLFIWCVRQIKQGKLPVLNVAKMGGAQEVIKLFNQLGGTLNVVVTLDIAQVNDVYVSNGVNLEYSILFDDTIEELMERKSVLIVPRSQKSLDTIFSIAEQNQVSRCMISGQSAKFGFSKYDFAVPLSTHASYHEILNFVNQIDPNVVLTLYSFDDDMADSFNTFRKIPSFAHSFKRIKELNLDSALKHPVYSKRSSLNHWFS